MRTGRAGRSAAFVTASVLAALVVAPTAAPAATPQPTPTVSNRDVTPLLNPVTIAACNVGLGETVINTYQSRNYGAIDLKCGDSNSGYVHIRERHQNDWQQVVNIAGGGGNWDDLMEFITGQSISAPSPGYPINIGNGKACYTTPALIYSSSGVVVRTLAPTVVVSTNNKKVITSIPTTGSPSCNAS